MGTSDPELPSYWLDSTPETKHPALEREVVTDVAVIGGGITGLTTAYMLSTSGLSVVLIEAGRICAGATGFTTGKVTSQHRLIYKRLLDSHGIERATAYAVAQQAAVARIEEIANDEGIECDLVRAPSFVYTEEPARLRDLEEEREIAISLGLPFTLEEGADIGLPWSVAGALRLDDQILFHPRLYCLGLADAFASRDGMIVEETRALDVEEDGDSCIVKTERADVRADVAVMATQTPFTRNGAFFARTEPARSYAMAARWEDPPAGMYISAEEPTRSIRPHYGSDETVLIVGGGGHPTGRESDTQGQYEELERWATDRFGMTPEWRWSAQDFIAADHVPFIGPVTAGSPRTFVATGYAKWGMTNGTIAAMLISDAILGRENPWREAFDSTRIDAARSIATVASQGAETVKSLIADRAAMVTAADVKDLEPGTGAIVRTGGRAVAAFRDEAGEILAVKPQCTHLGCIVHFNDAERTWDCPCHGSRFGLDGRVLDGPATKDLEAVPLEEETS